MIVRKTTLDRIEIVDGGAIQLRFGLLLVEDGNEIDRKWHRTMIPKNGDVEGQMVAVNSHLEQMGKPAISQDDITKVRQIADSAWS